MPTPPSIAVISIYPKEGSRHSHVSALAGYSKNIFGCLPDSHRRRTTILTNVKTTPGNVFTDSDLSINECWQKGSLTFVGDILRAVRASPTLKVIHLQHEFNQFGSFLTVPLIPIMLCQLRYIQKKKVVITFHEVLSQAVLTRDFVEATKIPLPAWFARLAFRIYYRLACAPAHLVITQAERFRDVLVNEYGIKKPMEIIRIGSHPHPKTLSRTEARAKLTLPADAQVLLFFGMIDWRKGLELLLDAFDILPGDTYRLLIVGGPPDRIKNTPDYRSWHEQIHARIDANPAIRATGYIESDEIETVFRACDLVVLPYIVPQLVSAVLTMSLSYDRPFIGSDVFRGTVDDALLFAQDAPSFAAKIQSSLTTELSNINTLCEDLKKELSWEKSAAEMANVYDTLSPDCELH